MSGGGVKLRDVGKLADAGAAFDFEVPLSELPGLPPGVGTADGRGVRVKVRFGREQGFARADVSLQAQLRLVCQRCMQPMSLAVHTDSPVLIIESEREADDAVPGWETFLAPEGRLSLEALAAEELMLALPIVPLHGQGETCVAEQPNAEAPERAVSEQEAAGTTRPFADLRALLQERRKTPDK